METAITNGVKISVEVDYQPAAAEIIGAKGQYVFAYQVSIENLNDFPIQLLRRQWYICNALAIYREVEGPGVIGEQPVLGPNMKHQYISYCPLVTDMGKMYGSYLMKNLTDDSLFHVEIPEFLMILPEKLS